MNGFCFLALSFFYLDFYRPRIEDLHRLPSLACVEHNLEFAAAHRSWLLDMWTIYPHHRETIEARLTVLDANVRTWETLRHAHWYRGAASAREFCTCVERLKDLQLRIGEEAYHGGIMPDIVRPEWFTPGTPRYVPHERKPICPKP